jgi:hypothetical protein
LHGTTEGSEAVFDIHRVHPGADVEAVLLALVVVEGDADAEVAIEVDAGADAAVAVGARSCQFFCV